MLDIVLPQNPSGNDNRRSQPKRRRAISHMPRNKARNIQKVVTLDWRLPARLRRPIHEELKKERRKHAARQAIVKFEKHPLYKHESTGTPANRGIEHHTGDVYMKNKPGIQVSVPPYVGSFVRQKQTTASHKTKKVRSDFARHSTNSVAQARRMQSKQSNRIDGMPVRKNTKKIFAGGALAGERDVPFNWSEYQDDKGHKAKSATLAISDSGLFHQPINEPKRRFALPLHFSIFPLSFLSGKNKTTNTESKKKLRDSRYLTPLS